MRRAPPLRRDLRSRLPLRALRGSVARLADALLQPPPLGLDRGPALPAHRPHRRAPHHRLPGRRGDRAPPAAAPAVGLPQPGRLRLPALRARLVGTHPPVPVGAGPGDVRPAGVVRGEPGRSRARLRARDRGRPDAHQPPRGRPPRHRCAARHRRRLLRAVTGVDGGVPDQVCGAHRRPRRARALRRDRPLPAAAGDRLHGLLAPTERQSARVRGGDLRSHPLRRARAGRPAPGAGRRALPDRAVADRRGRRHPGGGAVLHPHGDDHRAAGAHDGGTRRSLGHRRPLVPQHRGRVPVPRSGGAPPRLRARRAQALGRHPRHRRPLAGRLLLGQPLRVPLLAHPAHDLLQRPRDLDARQDRRPRRHGRRGRPASRSTSTTRWRRRSRRSAATSRSPAGWR